MINNGLSLDEILQLVDRITNWRFESSVTSDNGDPPYKGEYYTWYYTGLVGEISLSVIERRDHGENVGGSLIDLVFGRVVRERERPNSDYRITAYYKDACLGSYNNDPRIKIIFKNMESRIKQIREYERQCDKQKRKQEEQRNYNKGLNHVRKNLLKR